MQSPERRQGKDHVGPEAGEHEDHMGPGLVVSMRTTWGPGLVGLIDAQHLEGGEHGGACRVLTYLLLTYLLTWKAASTAEPVEYCSAPS